MLSRVADSLYWMSRYLERAEHTARVMEVQLNLILERGEESEELRWARVMRSLGMKLDEEDVAQATELAHSITTHAEHAASIVACIMEARENARQVREQISSEMWEQLNRLFHEVRRAEINDIWQSGPLDFLEAIKEGAHLFHGITDSTMTHGDGWRFIQTGMYLERACSVATLIGVHFDEFPHTVELQAESDHLEWIGLLKSCTAFEAFCKVHTADPRPERIAEFLILHPAFPHSIRFSVDAVETALKAISAAGAGRRASRVERIAGRLRATLGFGQIDEIMSGGLQPFLANIQTQCAEVHSALNQVYITYPIEAALEA